jgi:hypothetical protein
LAAGLSTAVTAGTASACSCAPATEPQRYARAQHVFSGDVIGVTVDSRNPEYTYDDMYHYIVHVDQEYKGDVPATVEVVTFYMPSLCGLTLFIGTEYLVFANGDSSTGEVRSFVCDGTRRAAAGPPATTTSAVAMAASASACAAAAA